jgi:hypothetical protein
MATELNLFDKQRIASRPIFRAFIGKVGFVGFYKLPGGSERLRVSHQVSKDYSAVRFVAGLGVS